MRPLSRLLVPLCALAALLLAATPASARVAGKFAFVRAGHVYVKQTATPTVRPLQLSIQPTARHVAITMDGAKVVWSTTSRRSPSRSDRRRPTRPRTCSPFRGVPRS